MTNKIYASAKRVQPDGRLKCTKCGALKQPDDFFRNNKKNCFTGRRSTCKICCLTYNKAKYESDPEIHKARCKAWETRTRRSRLDGPSINRAKMLWHAARTRATKKGLGLDITWEYIYVSMLGGNCAVSGLPFGYVTKGRSKLNPFAPSVDRIDNSRGYTIDNVQIVQSAYNRGKNDGEEIDFIAMCCAVAERHASDPKVIQRLKELRNAEF